MKTKNWINIGAFLLVSDKLIVTDPCYSKDDSNIITAVKLGIWMSEVTQITDKSWGTRIAELRAYHKSYKGSLNRNWKDCNFTVDVDSGQAGIFDDKFYPEEPREGVLEQEFYERMCDVTLKRSAAAYDLQKVWDKANADKAFPYSDITNHTKLESWLDNRTKWEKERNIWVAEQIKDVIDAGTVTQGVVSSSGYGDGSYPAYYKVHKEKVVAVKIVFIDS